MNNIYLAETCKVVNLHVPQDINSISASSYGYVSLENYRHVDFIITNGATGSGSISAVTLKKSKSISGTSSSSLAVGHYYKNEAALGSASIANDTYTKTTVASSAATFNLVESTNNVAYIVPVDAADLGASSYAFVGISVSDPNTAHLCSIVAILSNARYMSDNPPSALS